MPKKLGEFLKGLILKAGQNPDDEKLKGFLDSPDLMNIEAPDEVINALDHNLLSVKDAQNNHPDIKKIYDKQVLDGIDAVLNKLVGEDEELKSALSSERNTYNKIPVIVSKIRELESKKALANSKPDKDAIQQQKDAYQSQLNDLTYKLKKAEEDKDKLKTDYDGKVMDIKKDSKLNHMVGGYKTIYDELDPEVKWDTISAIMNRELSKNSAEFFFDENGNFSIRKKDGTTFLGDNHQQIMPQAFIEQLLSRNKLLKVTSTDQQTTGDTNPSNGFNAPLNGGNGKPIRNYELANLAKQSLNDFNSSQVMGG